MIKKKRGNKFSHTGTILQPPSSHHVLFKRESHTFKQVAMFSRKWKPALCRPAKPTWIKLSQVGLCLENPWSGWTKTTIVSAAPLRFMEHFSGAAEALSSDWTGSGLIPGACGLQVKRSLSQIPNSNLPPVPRLRCVSASVNGYCRYWHSAG